MSKSNRFFHLNRRWFLRSAALASGAALTTSLNQLKALASKDPSADLRNKAPIKLSSALDDLKGTPNTSRPLKVVILGAGMAGLVAAYELEQRGHSVVILEADSSHIGGRLRTLRFENGLHGEAGGMRFPETHNLTSHYMDLAGVERSPFVMGNQEGYYYLRGQRVRVKDAASLNQFYNLSPSEKGMTVDDMWLAALHKPLEGLSKADMDQLYTPEITNTLIRKYDNSSLLDLMYEAGLSEEAIEMTTVAYGVNGNLYNSALATMRDEPLWVEKFVEVVGGSDVFPKKLTALLKTQPRMSSEVIAIERDDRRNKATAVYRNNGSVYREEGDFVLCTIPFPVLQRIEAPFSGPKWRTIRSLNYDSATKTLAIANRRFWETDDGIYGGGSFSADLGATYYPADNAQAKDPQVSASPGVMLASYAWGTLAHRQASLSPNDRNATVRQELVKLHPQFKEGDTLKRLVSWAWDNHPWAGGAYALLTPRQQQSLYKDVVSPEGRIYFAGEHASTDTAWVQGSIDSALRAVKEMLVKA